MRLRIRRYKRIERSDAEATVGKREKRRRGQSMVELALLLPLLVLLLSIIVEGGLALNAWVRVNTAARDATRFALDQGRSGDVVSLVLYKLKGVDFGTSHEMTGSVNIDIWRIQGSTSVTGTIPNDTAHWKPDQIYNGNGSGGDTVSVTRSMIETRFQYSGGSAANIDFIIVEVDFKYTPALGSLITPGTKLSMSSYAVIQQEPSN